MINHSNIGLLIAQDSMKMMDNSSRSMFNSTTLGSVDRETILEKTHLSAQTFVPERDHNYPPTTSDLPKAQRTNLDPYLAKKLSVIQLRKQKAGSMSKHQRRKQRKGIEKAETSRAKLDKKKQVSCVKSRNMKSRKV